MHAKTGKRKLVERLSSQGVSISYERVREIRRSISNQVCRKYNSDGFVCPSELQYNLFTTSAIDNVDHNPTSSTSETSFHGTTISVFQHADVPVTPKMLSIEHFTSGRFERLKLPKSYTEIKPTRGGKPEPPPHIEPQPTSTSLLPSFNPVYEEATSWIEKLAKNPESPEERMSFSAFYSVQANPPNSTSSNLLPLIPEPVTAPATVRHATKIVMGIVEEINPGQQPVITGDQPVYALGKQLQWMFPEEFENVVWLLGPLHIEQNFIKAIGDWLEGSGWTKIYEYSTISTLGRTDSFLTCSGVSGIKRARYANQVTLSALITLATDAFRSQSEYSSYKEWQENISNKSVTAKYWFTVIELQVLLFMFIRSLRESNFDMFIRCFEEMLPWLAVLDHRNYLMWGSVFLNDMKNLSAQVFEAFAHGHFTVKKSNRLFSAIGIDQAHEQNNKVVKVDGGAIGILDNEQALLEWALSGPYISNIIQNYDCTTNSSHYEDTASFEKKFRMHRTLLVESFQKFDNPFVDPHEGLINIVSKEVLSENAAKSVMDAHKIGQKQYSTFMQEKIMNEPSARKSLYCTIKKNNLILFRSKNAVKTPKSKLQTNTLKERVQLYSSLYVGCKSRQANLEDFFSHENHEFPSALSECGNIRKPTAKADFLKCLSTESDKEQTPMERNEPPMVDAYIVDGAALVQMNAPKLAKTYGEYAETEVCNKVKALANKCERVDIVFDIYKNCSRKRETCEGRGKNDGVRVSIRKNTPVFRKFNQVMAINENKTELFTLIADTLVEVCQDISKTIVSTRLQNVVSNHNIEKQYLQPCEKEEADDRMFIHAKELIRLGFKKLMIVTVDTDVVVIAMYIYWDLDVEELWIEFGAGKFKRWLPIHAYAHKLGEEVCRALLFWYALTGCDTVSQFHGCGKKTAWLAWGRHMEARETFARYIVYLILKIFE